MNRKEKYRSGINKGCLGDIFLDRSRCETLHFFRTSNYDFRYKSGPDDFGRILRSDTFEQYFRCVFSHIERFFHNRSNIEF